VYAGSGGKLIDNSKPAVLYDFDNTNYLKLVDFVNDPRYKFKNDGISSIKETIYPGNITAGFITTADGASHLDRLRESTRISLEDEADQDIPRDYIRISKTNQENQTVEKLQGAASGLLSVRPGNIFFYPFTEAFDPSQLTSLPDIDTSRTNYPIIQFPHKFNYGVFNTLGVVYIDPDTGRQSRLRLEVAGNIGGKPYFRIPYDFKNGQTIFMYAIPVFHENRPIRPHEDSAGASVKFGRRRKAGGNLKEVNAVIKYLQKLKC
jgi:hypothetical protein